MARLFLGLDSSTQSLSAMVIDLDSKEVVYDDSIAFDEELPHYGTENGVLRADDPKVVHSPPLMWVEALDLAFSRLQESGVDLGEILAVSGSGQQHGSVYMNSTASQVIGGLDPDEDLANQLEGIFSRETSPIWMDSSTEEECEEIMASLGGMRETAAATGSAAFERFTGPQIRKFYKNDSEGYENTAHIALVSSFMASILAGQIAPIDHGDGAGMNLMDIENKTWHQDAVRATAPDLADKLPELAPSSTIIGTVSPYFAEKYGLNSDAQALVWSGDNPNSLIGVGLVKPGMVAISLGTSDTYFGFMEECHTDPRGEGHVFGAPTGDYMTLICFKNGSLARENIRDTYDLDWEGFSEALKNTPPGNDGKMMLPYFEPEIVPKVLDPGVRRLDLDEDDAEGNCRAVVEAQMMSMRIHSAWMGRRPKEIRATGGASANEAILRIMADVQNCPVYRFEVSNSAALGAALRAAQAQLDGQDADSDWDTVVAGFTEPVAGSKIEPDPEAAGVYDDLIEKFRRFEQQAQE
ncbi:MAG: carbohydrate kinase [Planctomycetes bacterium]|nr:carbohydrate kinase [Planctomycetota bacterium]